MYVDDLVTEGESLQEIEKTKSDSIELRDLNFTNDTPMNQIQRPTILALKKN